MSASPLAHPYPFDPTYGYSLAQLLAVEPPATPPGLADFWQQRYERALATSPRPTLTPTGETLGAFRVYDLCYASTGGVQIRGWLLHDPSQPVRRGFVVGHGYGGRDGPDHPLPIPSSVWLFPCFRGLGKSRIDGIPADPNQHVLHDILDRDRYVIGGCADDLWLGVSALVQLFPEASGEIAYLGTSFGGGIGALATPWDARIRRVYLEVPTFGHHPLRLQLPCVGSGEAVRAFQRDHACNVLDTLAYYDAAVTAKFAQAPTLVAVARFDPVVPPPGQFAVYNALPARLREVFVLDAGHFDYPERARQHQRLTAQLTEFLSANEPGVSPLV